MIRFVVRDRGGRGARFRVIDSETGETVRVSTARAGAQNQADALNAGRPQTPIERIREITAENVAAGGAIAEQRPGS